MRQFKVSKNIITDRSDVLSRYFNDISCIPMVTPEQETELAFRIRRGDDEAFRQLVGANLRFVVSVAKQFRGHGLDIVDLVNEGNLGLMKAATLYDPTRGFKFISYAVWWIRQAIMQALSENQNIVRMPLNKVGVLNKVNREKLSFLQRNELDCSPA